MSIATAITNLQGRVESAYDKIEERGGTLPQVLNTANLPDAIDSIPSGGGSTPKWGFTSLEEVCYTDADGDFRPFNGISGTTLNFTGLKSINVVTFTNMFNGNTTVLTASFPNLSSVTTNAFASAFVNCTGLTSVSFPELVDASYAFHNAFRGCSSLVSISFPKLSSVNGNTTASGGFSSAFYNCSNLTAVSFPALVEIGPNGNYAFNGAFNGTQVSSLTFPELTAIVANTGGQTTACFNTPVVSAYYFPKLTVLKKKTSDTSNNAQYIFNSTCKEIHFAAANQEVIEASQYYSTRWNAGSGCSVFFDL